MTDSGAERAARRIVKELSESLERIAPLLGLEPHAASALTSEGLVSQWTTVIQEETGTQWIPVGERLPEQGQDVRVWIIDDNSAIGGERREYEDVWVYDREHPYWAGCNQSQRITHWMSLPAAPDEGG